MKLHIIARGKIGKGEESALVDRYVKRITWPIALTELPDRPGIMYPETKQTPVRTILLDEKGDNVRSQQLAQKLADWRDDGVRETRFLIGGADGFSDKDRSGADWLIAFGKATWPHLLVRAMLAEQIWRATSILAGHPYHREG